MAERNQLALVADYNDFVRALRARREQLNISMAELDAACGFAAGTAAKYLIEVPPDAKFWGQGRTHARILGHKSFGTMLFCLGLALSVIEDAAALRQAGEFKPRNRSYVRKQVAVCPWLITPATAREMAVLANASMTPARRQKRARTAAKARWRKV